MIADPNDDYRCWLPADHPHFKKWVNTAAPLSVGDTFTMTGQYRRRTLWEWLTRKPRELQTYRVTETV